MFCFLFLKCLQVFKYSLFDSIRGFIIKINVLQYLIWFENSLFNKFYSLLNKKRNIWKLGLQGTLPSCGIFLLKSTKNKNRVFEKSNKKLIITNYKPKTFPGFRWGPTKNFALLAKPILCLLVSNKQTIKQTNKQMLMKRV